MHRVADDDVGILAGAVLSSVFGLAGLAEVVVEYILGFAFGWTIFQALLMHFTAHHACPRVFCIQSPGPGPASPGRT
jgi:hypothetical protein